MTNYLHYVSAVLFAVVSPFLHPGIVLAQSGGSEIRAPAKKFDGIWVGHTSVTLIKEFATYVILQGKDKESTWMAKGRMDGDRINVTGNGFKNDGEEFVFESTITYIYNGQLRDAWKSVFQKGKGPTIEGVDMLWYLSVPDQPRQYDIDKYFEPVK